MNLNTKKWTKEIYQEYIYYLKSISEEKYKNFHSNIVTTNYEILGIRLPIQRKIAKDICKGNILSFLECAQGNYYEEIMIKGFVISNIIDKKLFLNYIETYVLQIDNWAICDSFCNSLKIINNDKEFWFKYFVNYLKSKHEFKVRVGLVVFLNFYVDKEYVLEIFKLIDELKTDKYYVNMAVAWLLCECFIKNREETLNYLLNCEINSFTFNKTISKINDSYRVSFEDKKYLQSLKRKDRYEKF